MSEYNPMVIRKEALQVLVTAALDAYRADLRAQVMALASPDPEYNNAIGDVLALLDALSIIDGGDE